ncbi:MAG: hypothetical protein CMJ12_04930 [Pelagibacterales bacterium]|nr:hypothetical protein [Pelagibacterales bacterium]PPR16557.1 MAG: hypothetical protein CFH33_00587 [Alphaproteobacteria bacterium MarineAlpha9_Bin3]|tara:strand:+ start:6124 stop:6549 length:426 start_codon:yes stop_codon:yes gene_type:complete
MIEPLLYQIRIYFSTEFSDIFRSDKSNDKKQSLLTVLEKHNGVLLSQYDGFMSYVIEAEKNGIENYPLYQWTKDCLEIKNKVIKYKKSFTIYIDNEEVYAKDLADNIERDLMELVDKLTILRISKHDTNPKNNPQPPTKYR